MPRDKSSVDAVQKVLGEPASAELTDNAWKIRTNLIFAAIVSIAVVYGDLHIDPDSQIFGLKFNGFNDTVLTNGLTAAVAYLLIHFLWASLDSLLEWRLRVTGTRVAFVTVARLASQDGDYPGDPRQSTLYNWWLGQAQSIGDLGTRWEEVNTKLTDWETTLRVRFAEGADAMNIVNATNRIRELREDLARFGREVQAASGAIQSQRIPASLERFDSWYALFLRSQNLRWLLVDFLAPVLTGGYALCLLLSR